jgi:hypothetical protein
MKTKGIVAMFVLVFSLSYGSSICYADSFDSVRCGSDVRKALLGRTMSNEKGVVIEERHKDLDLKDLGAQKSQTIYSSHPGKSVERSTSFSKIKVSCETC